MSTATDSFYSDALRYQVQLLWMQTWLFRIVLILVLLGNAYVVSGITLLFFVRSHAGPVDNPFLGSSVATALTVGMTLLFAVTAVYAGGLLLYGWRVRQSARARATTITRYDLALTPIELAALVGKASQSSERWYIMYRLIDTGNLTYYYDAAAEQWYFQRCDDSAAWSRLRWYEQQIMTQHFPLIERADDTRGVVPLDAITTLLSSAEMITRNQQIQRRLIKDGVFAPLSVIGVWAQSLLFSLLASATIFAVLMMVPMTDSYLQLLGQGGLYYDWSDSLGLALVLACLVVGIVGGTWFLRTDIYTRFGLRTFVDAQGLQLYLRTVYQDRLARDGLSNAETLRLLPYAQVLGVVTFDQHDFVNALQLAKRR